MLPKIDPMMEKMPSNSNSSSSSAAAAVPETPKAFLTDPAGYLAASRQEVVTCPSSDMIRTRARCRNDDHWIDCYRDSCCPGYTLVVGRCIPDTEDPCSPEYGLCEQQCSTYFGRVICTCFAGFNFNKTRLSLGIRPTCEDKNECEEENGGCQHVCENTVGSYSCSCREGSVLQEDELSCRRLKPEEKLVGDEVGQGARGDEGELPEEGGGQELGGVAAFRAKPAVRRLQRTVNRLEEKFRALNSAIKLYSFAGGVPGPEGPSGPPGPPGPRGFPGTPGTGHGEGQDENVQQELDTYVELGQRRGRGTQGGRGQYCACKRGAVGPPGAPGETGPRGWRGEPGSRGQKGEEGSFDFLLAIVKDLRTDIDQLKAKLGGRQGGSLDPRRFGGQG